jgi:cytochrome c553
LGALALASKPNGCPTCHGDTDKGTPPLLDYPALGYTKERAEFLSHLPLAHEIQGIRQGKEFHLPRLGEE